MFIYSVQNFLVLSEKCNNDFCEKGFSLKLFISLALYHPNFFTFSLQQIIYEHSQELIYVFRKGTHIYGFLFATKTIKKLTNIIRINLL